MTEFNVTALSQDLHGSLAYGVRLNTHLSRNKS